MICSAVAVLACNRAEAPNLAAQQDELSIGATLVWVMRTSSFRKRQFRVSPGLLHSFNVGLLLKVHPLCYSGSSESVYSEYRYGHT